MVHLYWFKKSHNSQALVSKQGVFPKLTEENSFSLVLLSVKKGSMTSDGELWMAALCELGFI